MNSLARCVSQHGTYDPRTPCNFHSSIQFTKSRHLQNCLTFTLFPERNPYQNRLSRNNSTSVSLLNANPCEHSKKQHKYFYSCQNRVVLHVLPSLFQLSSGFRCQSNLPFCVDKEKRNPAKPYIGLPQASNGINNVIHSRFL